MSDLEGVDPETAALLAEPDEPERLCPDCDITEADLPAGANLGQRVGLHRKRTHGYVSPRPYKPKGRKVPPAQPRPAGRHYAGDRPKDRPPTSIKVTVGGSSGSKSDPVLAQVEQRAKQLAQGVAVGLLLLGQADDARDVQAGSEQWARSVRELAVYESWLKNLAAGGEASARAIAWLQFAMATMALSLPILLRHGAIPESIARFLSMADLAAAPTPAPAPAPPVDDPAPAEHVAA